MLSKCSRVCKNCGKEFTANSNWFSDLSLMNRNRLRAVIHARRHLKENELGIWCYISALTVGLLHYLFWQFIDIVLGLVKAVLFPFWLLYEVIG